MKGCVAGGISGFTLIELMVVMAIVVILSAMLMSMLAIGRTTSRKTATQAVLHKVDTALRLFKVDFKAYPYQASYPAAGVTNADAWTNRLHYQLGTDISDSDRLKVVADMETAARQYDYVCAPLVPGGLPVEQWPAASVHVFVADRHNGVTRPDEFNSPEGDDFPDEIDYQSGGRWVMGYEDHFATCAILNRMAAERARLLMLIGDVAATGVKEEPLMTYVHGEVQHGRDNSGIALVANPQSVDRPGWAVDYLQGELEARYVDGDQILDAYHHPLIYICQVLPGCSSTLSKPFRQEIGTWSLWRYGLLTKGRTAMADLHSDVMLTAAPGYEVEFELWSAGPDGQFSSMRDDPLNQDNIPCETYNRGLH